MSASASTVDEQLRRHDQPGAQPDERRPGGVVELRFRLRLHGDAGARGQPVRRWRARRVRSPGAELPPAAAPGGDELMLMASSRPSSTTLEAVGLEVALDADAGIVKAIDGLNLAITRG